MAQGESGDRVSSHRVTGPGNPITRSQITRSSSRLLKNGCGCRGWPFATRDAGDSLRQGCFSLEWHREQKASHRKRLRRRGAVCGVGAPPRCAPASPSSRLLASDPAALATPPTPFFSNLLEDPGPAGPAKAVPSGNLGRLAFGFLAVCVASGIALTPFYSP